MEIRQLQYFIEVCEDKSFSKCSARLDITQQALSQSIKHLEKELGARLFIRTSQGLKLTAVGQNIIEDVRSFIADYNILFLHMQTAAHLQRGSINLGIPSGIIAYFIPTYLHDFQRYYPDIQINIVEVDDLDCEKQVLGGILDIGCTIAPVSSSKLTFIPFVRKNSLLMVHKDNPLAKRKELRFKDLKGEKFVLVDKIFKRYHTALAKCRAAGFEPEVIYTSSQIEVLAGLIQKNLGITILMENLAMQYSQPPIVTVPIAESENYKWEAGFIFRNDIVQKPLITTLIDFVKSRESLYRVRGMIK